MSGSNIIEQSRLRQALLGEDLYFRCFFPDPGHPVTQSDLQRRLNQLHEHNVLKECPINEFTSMCALSSSIVKNGCVINKVKQDELNASLNDPEYQPTAECALCLETETFNKRLVAVCPNAHLFHADCILKQTPALRPNHNEEPYMFKCPTCREPLFSRFFSAGRVERNKSKGIVHPVDKIIVPTSSSHQQSAGSKMWQNLQSTLPSWSDIQLRIASGLPAIERTLTNATARAQAALFGEREPVQQPRVEPQQHQGEAQQQPVQQQAEAQVNNDVITHIQQQLEEARQEEQRLQERQARVRQRDEAEDDEETYDARPSQRRRLYRSRTQHEPI